MAPKYCHEIAVHQLFEQDQEQDEMNKNDIWIWQILSRSVTSRQAVSVAAHRFEQRYQWWTDAHADCWDVAAFQ